jgi:predicted acetyltransferase
MTNFTVGPPADDAEFAAYGTLVRQVYNTTDDAMRAQWLERAGRANIRVVRDGAAVVGGLLLIPMGQWFGGRSVPMNGVAAVAVAPEHRSRGAATAMMRAAVAEMRATGFPISTLYPATQPLYRAAGYERAGAEWRISVRAPAFDVRDRELALRVATADDEPAMEDAYRRRALTANALLDRSRYVWDRIRRPLAGIVFSYVVEGPGGIEGVVRYVTREPPAGQRFDASLAPFALWCPDLVALTPAAARRLATFFADHASMTGEVAWRGPPSDPVLAVLREQVFGSVTLWNTWMLRITDVAAALTARGYAPGVEAEVHLDVADEHVPENAGRWLVRIADGRAEVSRGGRGAVRCDVRGLAPLYTGFQSAAELRASGLVDATDADLAAASAAFACGHPWMADHF